MLLKFLRRTLGQMIATASRATSPRPVQRTPGEQLAIERESGRLALYHFPGCPFCTRTRRAIERLSLPIELRDAMSNATHRAELRAGGGEIQVPCLRIEQDGESCWLYESRDIVAYLERRFGAHDTETRADTEARRAA